MKQTRHMTLALVLGLAGCGESAMPQHIRDNIDERMAKARETNDCLIASDILRELEDWAEIAAKRTVFDKLEGESGWTEQDNQRLIEWRAEQQRICETERE